VYGIFTKKKMILVLLLLLLLLLSSVVLSEDSSLFGPIQPGVWTWVSGNAEYISYDIGSTNRLPSMYGTSTCTDENEQFAYVFGGKGTNALTNNFLYQFNLQNYEVLKVSGSPGLEDQQMQSGRPTSRESAALWFSKYDGLLYLFSGYNFQDLGGNDLWTFNLTDSKWNLLGGNLTDGKQYNYSVFRSVSYHAWPPARSGSLYWEAANGNLWMAGGFGYHPFLLFQTYEAYCASDIWMFDVRLKQWAWMNGGTSYEYANTLSTDLNVRTPGPLCYNTYGKSNENNLFTFGGGSASSYWLWQFNSTSLLWETISLINVELTPQYRSYGRIVSIGRNLLLVSGGRAEIKNFSYSYQDTWTYFVPSNKWNWISGRTFASSSFNTPNFPIGSSSSQSIYPGTYFSAFKKNNDVFFIGGLQIDEFGRSKSLNTIFKYSICPGNQYFQDMSCNECALGTIPCQSTSCSLDRCVIVCEYGAVYDGLKCSNCSFGTYSNHAQKTCSLCAKGKYSDSVKNADCILCPIGKYNGFYGKSACFDCPDFSSNAAAGSESTDSCFCNSGYFGTAFKGQNCSVCSTLPGLFCGPNSTYPSALFGYFKNPQNPNIVYECSPPEACLSSNSSFYSTTCTIGYTGWMCGSCVEYEFYKSGANCVECPSIAVKVLIFTSIAIVGIYFFWRLSSFKSFSTIASIKIVLFWIQIIALYPSLSTNWSRYLRIFFNIISFVNFDIELFFPGIFLKINLTFLTLF
jgi:hypothetical protein